ncbi:SulP family inorganic anion transporter [Niallia sp. 01092]|uniref:SulP family inorganic anion transporter n=1 Tax=unclassified Niallia TaxID=2837522 RepID=UPI003FD499BD
MLEKIKKDWFSNTRVDILAGMVVSLALIPEVIAFSIIAGVDPIVGLYTSFCIAVIISFAGGRSAMISAAAGAMALVLGPLVKEYGLQYLFAATILTGIIQVIFGVCKIAKLMKFIPRPVMMGFVNALAILIFAAQIPSFWGISNITYIFVVLTLLIVYILPKFIKSVPAPLIAIIILTAASIFGDINIGTVGDLGAITQTLPTFLIPNIPFSLETLAIIFPYSIALALVGLLESLLTATIVDDATGTDSNKNREARGQGIANIITGFFGGMAGCAMIGQTAINIKSGGRTRLSTLVSGLFLLLLILVLGELVAQIPMPVLAGIMIVVSISTFDWSSFSYLKKAPKTDVLVMLTTVCIIVATHDLSKGVIAGVILSAIFFVAKISKVRVKKQNNHTYAVEGQLFFASVEDFISAFNFQVEHKTITVDFSNARLWDDSAVGALDKVVLKYRENHNKVKILGLDAASQKIVDKLAVFDDPNSKLSS